MDSKAKKAWLDLTKIVHDIEPSIVNDLSGQEVTISLCAEYRRVTLRPMVTQSYAMAAHRELTDSGLIEPASKMIKRDVCPLPDLPWEAK